MSVLVFTPRFVDSSGLSSGCLGKTSVEFRFLSVTVSTGGLILPHALIFSFRLATSMFACLQVRLDGFLPFSA